MDFSATADSSDLALVCEFETRAALAAYQEHPAHKAVMPLILEARSERRLVDYELSRESAMDASWGPVAIAASVVFAVMYVVRGRRRKDGGAKILPGLAPRWHAASRWPGSRVSKPVGCLARWVARSCSHDGVERLSLSGASDVAVHGHCSHRGAAG